MLLFTLIALCVLIFILFIHYYQHFEIKCKYKNKSTNSLTTNQNVIDTQMELLKNSQCNRRCCCILQPVDDEGFDFFPASFLFYLILMMILFILIIVIEVMNYFDQKNVETITDLFLGYSLKSYHNNSLSQIHQINMIHVTDYILIYGILILSLWISLFSFYRYYTTLISTQTFAKVSTKKLFKKFRIYALVFSILFALQIHLYYYIFVLNVALFCSFNFYCTWKFAHMLITQYKLFIGLDPTNRIAASNEEVLNSVIFVKNASLICVLLNSIALTLFLVTYNVNILYYIPILLSISAFTLALNFVRTRKLLLHQWLSMKQSKYCKCICYKQVKAQKSPNKNHQVKKSSSHENYIIHHTPTKTKHVQLSDTSPTTPTPAAVGTDGSNYPNTEDLTTKQINQMLDLDTINSVPMPFKTNKFSKSVVIPHDAPIFTNNSDVARAQSAPISNNEQYHKYLPPIEEKKQVQKTIRYNSPIANLPQIDVEFGLSSTNSSSPRRNQNPKALKLLGLPATPSNVTPPDNKGTPISNILRHILPLPKQSKSISSPKSIKSQKSSKSIKSLTKSRKSIEIESDSDEKDLDDRIDVVLPMTQSPRSPISIRMTTMHNDNEEKGHHEPHDPAFQFNEMNENPTALGKTKSSSAPTGHGINIQQDMDDMLLSLNVLAKYGFCSKKSIKSVKEITMYQRSINTPRNEQNIGGVLDNHKRSATNI